jgi:asparagine synthase (glutamine-hydrolysing)
MLRFEPVCGISVIVAPQGDADAAEMLRRMHAPIRHRGPDGEGLLVWDGRNDPTRVGSPDALPDRPLSVGMAFRRLKIVDLSERASQPMRSAQSPTWLVFNGEIYNYRPLRDELRAAGHRFNTESDSEVILAAYEEWGTECFRRLDGMWAIVLLDIPKRRVVVSRDRLAIKPLYWSIDDNRLLLASEIRQIVNATGKADANHSLVGRYLRSRRMPVFDETFFSGVRSVPAATWFEVPIDEPLTAPAPMRYWSLTKTEVPSTYSRAREVFDDLMRRTVATHRQGDVRIGSLLSGGLDSGVLATLLADANSETLPVFSFGFRERAPEYCELGYVDAVVKTRRNIEPHETTLTSSWLAANASRAIATLEEPPLALPAIAQYRVFESCREHDVTVVFDGEGSDEILGGYWPNQRALLVDQLRARKVGRFARELLTISRRQEQSLPRVFYDFFGAPFMRRATTRDYDWLREEMRMPSERIDRSRDPSLLNRTLHDATFNGNVKIVLGYTDKNAMAHSVEARVPYMDHHVVELAFSLPGEFKAGNGDRKRILRDLGRTLLPAQVTERKDRMGFNTPDHLLMAGEFGEVIRRTITDDSFASLPLFHRPALTRFIDDHFAGRNADIRAIWRLYALAAWIDEFSVRF